MNAMQSLDAYRNHSLNIEMRTSSGDVISMDMQNTQALQMQSEQTGAGRSASFSFASMQSFRFEMTTNGLSEQDREEIAAFMEIAQPYIDNFMNELAEGNQTTPLNRVADAVTEAMSPLRAKPEAVREHAKHDLVDLLDRSMARQQTLADLIEESQTLLEKILRDFDSGAQNLYV